MYINQKLEDFNKVLSNKRVAIIGLGVSNIPLLDYLHKYNAEVFVFDNRDIKEIPDEIIQKIKLYSISYYFGEDNLSKLYGFDLIFRSPSCLPTIPELEEEAKKGAIITTEIELLMKMCPCKIIGITGSDGKTTTTTLIYEIIKTFGINCHLGGNIGIPLFTKLNEIKPEDIVVLELSSFQLMEMEISPDISVITNITPNHLNIHKNYEEYITAKKNIFKFQNENGILVLNNDNEITKSFQKEAKGKVILFSSKEKLENGFIVEDGIIKKCEDGIRTYILNTKDVKLRGMHNYENICTALSATSSIVNIDLAVEIIKKFQGVEHRLELVREIDGVKWYNDSVSSSPTRTIAGLNSFNEEIVLIAGGYDKKLDYTPLAKPIVDKVSTLILIGQTSTKILNAVKIALEKQNKKLDIHMCSSLEETVELAKKVAKPTQVVLFSPASASFDMFKNFADRGEKFKQICKNI